MGKVTYVSVAVVTAAAVVLAERTSDWLKAGAVVLIVGFGAYVVRAVLSYAGKHPEAMLEGSELLAYHQNLAAKGISAPPDTPSVAGEVKIVATEIDKK